ncbi:hypothetical protein M513_13571 [Trichuris suis]|uniref:Uncharacterized protein n=1 Tax=Trichuris suis TaxID=68888 RepID=A0A085LKQ9_9BILA|nr:hypothetical protein M513_13571 [Trichuris suis]
MVDLQMGVANSRKAVVGTPFVSHDGRPQSNMIPYNGQQGVAAAVGQGDKEALDSFAAHSS